MAAEKKRRNPFIAALLSLLAPGLGQIYNGKGALGLAFFLIDVALPFLWGLSGWLHRYVGFIALVIVAIVFWLFTIVHAFIQARRIKEAGLRKYQTIPVYAFFIIISLGLTIFAPARFWKGPLGISPYRITTEAMMPTLQTGDLLIADIKAYRDRAPARGDLIVFEYPPDPTKQFVKRAIALEGDSVEIRDKMVYINDQPIDEPYKVHKDSHVFTKNDPLHSEDVVRDNFGPLKIPAGNCFVLGDNRDNSMDSRFFGALPVAKVKGRVLYIYWAKDKKRIGLTPK
jgi:signal peptidase I